MKKSHKPQIATAVILAMILAGCELINRPPDLGPEPSYNGRSLSEWLMEYETYWPQSGFSSPDIMWMTEGNVLMTESPEKFDRYWQPESGRELSNSANYAIWHIGTNAHPFLLKWMEDADVNPFWEDDWRHKLNVIIWKVTKKMPLQPSPAARRAETSAKAFCALGSRGEAAIGGLTVMLNNRTSTDQALLASYALVYLGNNGRAAIMSAMTNQNNHPQVRTRLVECYPKRITVHSWLQLLQDHDARVRTVATNMLSKYGPYIPGYSSELE